ncbi:MAG: DUF7210 family protein [Thiomonas sp.]
MRIRLHRPHTHAGISYPAHHEIDLPEADARWLLENEGAVRAQVVEQVKKAKLPVVEPKPEPEPTAE